MPHPQPLLTAVTDETFAELVLAADRPVVLDFWADWCPSCARISASLTELAEEFGPRLHLFAIDADANPETMRAYKVMSLPTLLVFRSGELTGSLVGARPKAALRMALGELAGLDAK
ncbi:thioredoxin family protein [Catellatospora tritici]|uniref:thioredoxin family protein n=1 Tax=Catellatospora tritici TaxID=2851566 RepID=UPI001C2D24EE|nr:thioredoxin domain-containing protein [Catellatospora tritici]MBV1851805.1 thioredoxin fold domain-containing protein [Catellatospora tritici]